MRFNSAPINGAAFNADVPGSQPAAPENGGGASFPFSRPMRGTALFASPQRAERVERPVTAVAMAAKQALRPAAARDVAVPGSTLLRRLADLRLHAADQAPAVDAALGRLRVDIILVDMGALLMRLELDAIAALEAQAEEDEAVAMLMLLCD
jgi:hypothetical protein